MAALPVYDRDLKRLPKFFSKVEPLIDSEETYRQLCHSYSFYGQVLDYILIFVDFYDFN